MVKIANHPDMNSAVYDFTAIVCTVCKFLQLHFFCVVYVIGEICKFSTSREDVIHR